MLHYKDFNTESNRRGFKGKEAKWKGPEQEMNWTNNVKYIRFHLVLNGKRRVCRKTSKDESFLASKNFTDDGDDDYFKIWMLKKNWICLKFTRVKSKIACGRPNLPIKILFVHLNFSIIICLSQSVLWIDFHVLRLLKLNGQTVYKAVLMFVSFLFLYYLSYIIPSCLSRQYVGQDYTQKRSTGEKVTLDQIDSVSVLALRLILANPLDIYQSNTLYR